ncbi:unnamed protein product [Trifolium pratense]|uniref:Uncharacterized protein n=1 Tax=Trifolium pratense TaxID=57577 RepID=A0ACB0JW39_TRIPR|nr:unnamed protein product [Trifolium pratense]
MQGEKNMASNLKFVHAILLFISLFLIAKNDSGFEYMKCKSNIDCPETTVSMFPFRWKCIEEICEFVRPMPMNV